MREAPSMHVYSKFGVNMAFGPGPQEVHTVIIAVTVSLVVVEPTNTSTVLCIVIA